MTIGVQEAALVPAPISDEGDVLVIALTASAQTLTVQSTRTKRPVWYRVHADGQAAYVTFGPKGPNDSTHTAPAISAVSGGGRAVKIESGDYMDVQMGGPGLPTAIKVIAAAASGYLRVTKVGVNR